MVALAVTHLQHSRVGSGRVLHDRVDIAMARYRAALKRHGGEINVTSISDAVAFGVKNIHNSDRKLGDHRNDDFRRVVWAAVTQLIKLGLEGSPKGCRFDEESGSLRLVEMPARKQRPQRRRHGGDERRERRR